MGLRRAGEVPAKVGGRYRWRTANVHIGMRLLLLA